MERFLIESGHTPEDCVSALKQVVAIGYLTHFDWGCKAGEHKGWAIIEAENEAEALLVVPSSLRPKARVVRLVRFSIEQVRGMH